MVESRKMGRPPWVAVTGTGDIASGSIISLVAEAWYTDITKGGVTDSTAGSLPGGRVMHCTTGDTGWLKAGRWEDPPG